MTKKIYALAALALAATPSFATDLWDQQSGLPAGPNASFPTAADCLFSDFASANTYIASDVEVGAGGWTVNQISMEVVGASVAVETITHAQLNVFANPSSNSLPTPLDPTMGPTVSVSVTAIANNPGDYLVTASGLNLTWAQGEYWVGLTSLANYSAGQEIWDGYITSNVAGALQQSAMDNPGGYDGLPNNGWNTLSSVYGSPNPLYAAIDIQGTVNPAPEPASIALLGLGAVGILRRRRNRK